MVKLDFLSFGSKKPAQPLDNGSAAKSWYAKTLEESGAGAHQKCVDLLAYFNLQTENLTAGTLEALLAVDQANFPQHQQLCAQYLLNSKMPKTLEEQLRGRILTYNRQIVAAYQRFLDVEPTLTQQISPSLPLMVGRMMYYLCEQAMWQYYRHASPDVVFWSGINQLFLQAESKKLDTLGIVLFDGLGATTVHDIYLGLLMVSVLMSGNLNARQLSLSLQIAQALSNRMSLTAAPVGYPSFAVCLDQGKGGARVRGDLPIGNVRYWNTAELVEQVEDWHLAGESGALPAELKKLMMTGGDVSLLRYLAREWAERPHLYKRAERVHTEFQQIEVAHRLPLVHRLVREHEESLSAGKVFTGGMPEEEQFRVYGFVSSRRRDKTLYSGNAMPDEPRQEFPFWELDNKSATGLGANLPASGNDWVSLGGILGFRERGEDAWSVGVIRRIQRPTSDRIYLGIQVLGAKPIAASLQRADGSSPEETLPAEMIWLKGEIGLFVPLVRQDKKLNTLLLSVSGYAQGRELIMVAKQKRFQIRLGKLVERGVDWCQAEIDLVATLP